ncbi:MAG: DivIVA domain-containing protein [Actinomycetota bacterium]
MKLTPLDIHHKEFRRAIRGYNEEEVDAFLDEVAEEFERLFKENIELKEQLEKLQEKVTQYENIEQTLQKTLVTAQKMAEEVQANAKKEAELIVKDAELKAKATIQDILEEKQNLQVTYSNLKQAEEEFRARFKAMLESYLSMIAEAEKELKGEEVEEIPAAEEEIAEEHVEELAERAEELAEEEAVREELETLVFEPPGEESAAEEAKMAEETETKKEPKKKGSRDIEEILKRLQKAPKQISKENDIQEIS